MFRLFAAVALCATAAAQEPAGLLTYSHENVLGTSMTLRVATADAKVGAAVERAALAEIERLDKILSRWRADSELSRFNRSSGPFEASPELLSVVRACSAWRVRTEGAFHAGIQPAVELWAQAEKAGKLPSAPAREAVRKALQQPQIRVDSAAGTIERRGAATIYPDALAKGAIIDRALAAGLKAAPGLRGLSLDIGGDLRVRGMAHASKDLAWVVEVADPQRPADNAAPLARLALSERAVATSGDYARYYTIAGQRFSHVLDPRWVWPANKARSATVVALDAQTADALATALHVLGPAGVKLAEGMDGVECLIIDAEGRPHASRGWKRLLHTGRAAPRRVGWPIGELLAISLELPRIRSRRYRRPYVAVWIEDEAGKPVRTLAVWGDERKYLRDLRSWWRFARSSSALVRSVTRATRRPGSYELVWDGTDDGGQPLVAGSYTVHIEVVREHGGREHRRQAIVCGKQAQQAAIEGKEELGKVTLRYGKYER